MHTEVYRKLPARFDMCGRFLGYPLQLTDETISEGLAKRLLNYAVGRIRERGFEAALAWDVTITTSDYGTEPADRYYSVAFRNAKGGQISVVGILTIKGWPFVDHRFTIEEG